MGKYILVIPSSGNPGEEDEYNNWYDQVHLPDVLEVPGVISGKRFDAIPESPAKPPEDTVAIYELELDNPTEVLAEIGRRVKSGQMKISSAMKPGAQMWIYKAR